MKTRRFTYTPASGWTSFPRADEVDQWDLVLVFASTTLIQNRQVLDQVKTLCPGAYVCGCSTAGEIAGEHVLDDSASVLAMKFDHTRFRVASAEVESVGDSFATGKRLSESLPVEGLVHVFVLSDGLTVNGSELVKGLTSVLPQSVAVTGGLSGDGARFFETIVCVDGEPRRKHVLVIGFYGDHLRVGFGSMGGWDPFGPVRKITRSNGNVLHELDGRSALELYKEYLGDHAAGLPASGLLFPLSLRSDNGEGVVRTILGVNDQENSMTFAGDMPEGAMVRLMRANFDRLVDGAAGAAQQCRVALTDQSAQAAILISCVGRKLVLKQRIEEEVESVVQVLGQDIAVSGFYSYGEISPFTPEARCALHNQTMTVTTFSEI